MKRFHLAVLFVALAATSCGFLPKRASDIRQAIWVTRWDYKTERDVREVIRNCAKAGFDTVLFQVRGNGTVFYRSNFEPWAEEFGFRDPGFDPLAVACEEARVQGVQLQAWINAVPGWRGDKPPADDRQLYHTRSEWFLVDQDKNRQALKPDAYIALNPCLPAVRDYIARICEEVAFKYPVDGVHLDYIRFLEKEEGKDYPRDNTTLELYRQATQRTPDEDPAAWDRWKADQITELVREIRRRLRRAERRCLLTAAVYRTPERAATVQQDWPAWLAGGLVDAVFPMAYERDEAQFGRDLQAILEAAPERAVVVGIGTYDHKDPDQTVRQMELVREAGLQGYSMFAYSSFFGTGPDQISAENASAKVQRRERVLPKIQTSRLVR